MLLITVNAWLISSRVGAVLGKDASVVKAITCLLLSVDRFSLFDSSWQPKKVDYPYYRKIMRDLEMERFRQTRS
jgi:hypothetical protein